MERCFLISNIIHFFVGLIACTVGSISGIGGGIIIKATLDAIKLEPLATINFISSCTVLAMAVVTLIRRIKSGSKVDWKAGAFLGAGAIAGGIVGGKLFELALKAFANADTLSCIQSVILFAINVLVLIYVINKAKVKTKHLQQPLLYLLIGLLLGIVSTFLGIGGGPLNLMVFYYFFSMDEKTAAANSIFLILLCQSAGLLTTTVTGKIPAFDVLNLVLMVVGGISGALLGGYFNKRMSNANVATLFKVVLVLIMLINLWNVVRIVAFA